MKDCQCFLTSDSVSMQNRRWSDSFPPPSLEQKEHKRDEQKNTGEI